MSRINVNILLFASLQERAGRSTLAEEVEEGTKLGELWDFLKERFGFQQLSEHVLMAKNGNLASKDTVVQDGDKISFFPPVSGG